MTPRVLTSSTSAGGKDVTCACTVSSVRRPAWSQRNHHNYHVAHLVKHHLVGLAACALHPRHLVPALAHVRLHLDAARLGQRCEAAKQLVRARGDKAGCEDGCDDALVGRQWASQAVHAVQKLGDRRKGRSGGWFAIGRALGVSFDDDTDKLTGHWSMDSLPMKPRTPASWNAWARIRLWRGSGCLLIVPRLTWPAPQWCQTQPHTPFPPQSTSPQAARTVCAPARGLRRRAPPRRTCTRRATP